MQRQFYASRGTGEGGMIKVKATQVRSVLMLTSHRVSSVSIAKEKDQAILKLSRAVIPFPLRLPPPFSGFLLSRFFSPFGLSVAFQSIWIVIRGSFDKVIEESSFPVFMIDFVLAVLRFLTLKCIRLQNCSIFIFPL